MEYDFYLPRLIQGRLLRRHQRFKADIELSDGSVITAHCPNSGSMKGCLKQGAVVYVSESKNPNRKLRYTWQLIRLPSSLVLVNTTFTNNIVQKALVKGKIRELLGYKSIKKEYMYEPGTRIDFLLKGERPCLLEVKSCTLVEDGIAFFPDAPTQRGRKHLKVLINGIKNGFRAVIFYLIHRMDANQFMPASHIDPEYATELAHAVESGVEILVYDILLDLKGILLNKKITCKL